MMLSYRLLLQALTPDPLTAEEIFHFSISSAASGFISHTAYVTAADAASGAPLADRYMSENVAHLVGADVNPLVHLLLEARSEDEFARRWNHYNEIAGLGVRTLLRCSAKRDFERRPQGPLTDSTLRCKIMTRFIEELRGRRGERHHPFTAKCLSETAKRLDVSDTPTGAAVSALQEFPTDDIQKCARRIGCSPRTLQRRLGEGHGNFAQIRHAMRVTIAASMIAGSDGSLSEIAVAAGFYDAPHFNKAMKRSMGITPRQFKSLLLVKGKPSSDTR